MVGVLSASWLTVRNVVICIIVMGLVLAVILKELLDV